MYCLQFQMNRWYYLWTYIIFLVGISLWNTVRLGWPCYDRSLLFTITVSATMQTDSQLFKGWIMVSSKQTTIHWTTYCQCNTMPRPASCSCSPMDRPVVTILTILIIGTWSLSLKVLLPPHSYSNVSQLSATAYIYYGSLYSFLVMLILGKSKLIL